MNNLNSQLNNTKRTLTTNGKRQQLGKKNTSQNAESSMGFQLSADKDSKPQFQLQNKNIQQSPFNNHKLVSNLKLRETVKKLQISGGAKKLASVQTATAETLKGLHDKYVNGQIKLDELKVMAYKITQDFLHNVSAPSSTDNELFAIRMYLTGIKDLIKDELFQSFNPLITELNNLSSGLTTPIKINQGYSAKPNIIHSVAIEGQARSVCVINGYAMYQSSGSNSGIAKTWLPFLGHAEKGEIGAYVKPWSPNRNFDIFKQSFNHIFGADLSAAILSQLEVTDHDSYDSGELSITTKIGRFGNLEAMCLSASCGGGFWDSQDGQIVKEILEASGALANVASANKFELKANTDKTISSSKINAYLTEMGWDKQTLPSFKESKININSSALKKYSGGLAINKNIQTVRGAWVENDSDDGLILDRPVIQKSHADRLQEAVNHLLDKGISSDTVAYCQSQFQVPLKDIMDAYNKPIN